MSKINVVRLFYGSRYKGSNIDRIEAMENQFKKEYAIPIVHVSMRIMSTILNEHYERTGDLTLGQEISRSIVNV